MNTYFFRFKIFFYITVHPPLSFGTSIFDLYTFSMCLFDTFMSYYFHLRDTLTTAAHPDICSMICTDPLFAYSSGSVAPPFVHLHGTSACWAKSLTFLLAFSVVLTITCAQCGRWLDQPLFLYAFLLICFHNCSFLSIFT